MTDNDMQRLWTEASDISSRLTEMRSIDTQAAYRRAATVCAVQQPLCSAVQQPCLCCHSSCPPPPYIICTPTTAATLRPQQWWK